MKQQLFMAPEGRVRIKLVVAYVGTAYCGWQIQARPEGVLPTVQGFLVDVASRIANERVHVHGAGRTDSGVHAYAQVAHMDVPAAKAQCDWQMALNNNLPPDIRIVSAEPAPKLFHAQLSAVRKRYVYRLWLNRRYTPPWLHPFVWACGPVDVDRMDAVARMLEGEHDFASLRNTGTDVESSVRIVHAISRTPQTCSGYCDAACELVWRFEANGFLKQMVRNSVGLLVAAGRGKLEPDVVPELLAAKDRRHIGVTAPARGLAMESVVYEEL